MASVISQLPPVTEPMMDQGGMMTLAWRRFFESQWLRSGGFQDYLYAAILAANTGDAVLAEVAADVDTNALQISELQAQIGGGMLEALQQATEELAKQVNGIQSQIAGNLSESLQEDIYEIRQQIGVLSALVQSINGENTPTLLQDFEASLGSAAYANIGTSGTTVPYLDGLNTWATTQTFTVAPVFTDQSGTRAALSLGTAALANTGTSGATLPFANGTNTWANTQTFTVAPVFTAQANTRTALGLVIGTDVQAFDADLSSIAAFSGTGSGGLIYRSASNTWSAVTVGANLGFAAGTLGSSLGTAATQNTGTSGANVPLLSTANTWSADQVFGSGAGAVAQSINGAAGTNRDLLFNTAGVNRWLLRTNSTAEGGANAGSDFAMFARDDAGVTIGSVFTIARATRIWAFTVAPTSPGYSVSGTAVVGTRKTGWTAATGTATRTTYDTATVTLPVLAEHVKALTDDLISHGLIGT